MGSILNKSGLRKIQFWVGGEGSQHNSINCIRWISVTCLICSLNFLTDLVSLTFSGKEFHNKAPL